MLGSLDAMKQILMEWKKKKKKQAMVSIQGLHKGEIKSTV